MAKAKKTVDVTEIDSRKVSEERRSLRQVDMHEVREEIVQLVSKHAFGMVLRTIGEAHNGHYAAMKFLFEMTGLYPVANVEENQDGDGLARVLLEQLGISPESKGDAVAENLHLSPVETHHAVK